MVDYQATKPIQHGGNQAAIRARLKLGNRPLLDFSAPLNALGPPPGALSAVREATETIDRYPEPGSPRLVERLAEYHGVPLDRIIVGAGTTDLIALIGQVFRDTLGRGRPASWAIPNLPLAHLSEPTYGEYRRTSAQNGLNTKVWGRAHPRLDPGRRARRRLRPVLDRAPQQPDRPGLGPRPTARDFIDRQPRPVTIVDEAYLPFLPDEAERTLVNEAAARDNLIVLRSMTKIFAFPGLRVGYAVASAELIRKFKRSQQPWTVTTAGEVAAIAAIDDEAYLGRTIDLIATEATRLTDGLWDLPGLRPVWPSRDRPRSAPSMPNFVLVSLVDTPWDSVQLQEALARRGLFARECSNYRGLEIGSTVTGPERSFRTNGHLRFCVRTPSQNDLLLAELSALMSTRPPS